MKSPLVFAIFLLFAGFNLAAAPIKPTAVKTYAHFMKSALEAKDAPATCWYLGLSEGYLQALKNTEDLKATQLYKEIKDQEGKCGGKNGQDLSKTFTSEEWIRLSELQKKIESAEL